MKLINQLMLKYKQQIRNLFLFVLMLNSLNCLGQQSESTVIKQLATRIAPQWSNRIVFEKIASDKDVFQLESRDGKLLVYGNNNTSMAMGFNQN